MSSQPTDPMIHARDDEDLDAPEEGVAEDKPGVLTIDGTDVIDASGVTAEDVATDDPTPVDEPADAPTEGAAPKRAVEGDDQA